MLLLSWKGLAQSFYERKGAASCVQFAQKRFALFPILGLLPNLVLQAWPSEALGTGREVSPRSDLFDIAQIGGLVQNGFPAELQNVLGKSLPSARLTLQALVSSAVTLVKGFVRYEIHSMHLRKAWSLKP